MKLKELYILLFFLLFGNAILLAQNKQLERANALFQDKSFVPAIEAYEKILEKEVLPEAMLNLALSYWELRKGAEAEQWFEIASLNGGLNRTNAYFNSDLLYTYAEVLKFNGKYAEARKQFLEYEKVSGNSKGGMQAKICTIIPVLMRDSSKVELKPFEYNTSHSEFAPQLKDDILYYVGVLGNTSASDIDVYTGNAFLDLLQSKYPETDSSEAPEVLSKRVNSVLNEGPLTFSRSGDKIIFTRNYFNKGKEQRRSDGFLGFGLFESNKVGEKWSDPVQLELGEIEYNYGHPSLSYNGETLYFVSDMPGGFGGTDIYMSTRLSEGWSTPRNLGPAINTQGNESYPYIHLTGSLYFASDYHQGLGGLDIFSAKKDEAGAWGSIRNLGYPINSSADDFALILKADSRKGYFSSNRPGGSGSDDIYSVFLESPVEDLMDIDSLIAALDSSVLNSKTDSSIAASLGNKELENNESNIMQIEKDALKNTSGGYFEFVYGDSDASGMSVEDELKLLGDMDLNNKAEVDAYFGEDKSLRTEEELQNELAKYAAKSPKEESLKTKEKEAEITAEKTLETAVESLEKEAAIPEEKGVETIADKTEKSTAKTEEKKPEENKLFWNDFLDRQGNLISNSVSEKFVEKSVKDLVFRIQIGAYRVPVFGGAENFFGEKNIDSYELQDNITRYLLPKSFSTLKEAESYRKSLDNERLKDAFIVPFLNAKRIVMDEALQMLLEK